MLWGKMETEHYQGDHSHWMQIFAKEWVEYPFNPIALASTTIAKESTSAMLSLTLSVNGPLQVTLTPVVTVLLHIASMWSKCENFHRIKKFIQEDSNLECTNSVVDWLPLLVHIWILNSDKIFAKII